MPAAEHMRPEGLCIGYYCPRCGKGGLNMYGMGDSEHTATIRFCVANPELVAELNELNKRK